MRMRAEPHVSVSWPPGRQLRVWRACTAIRQSAHHIWIACTESAQATARSVQQFPRVLAGNNVQASQQYVSSRVHWFTGAFFGQLFQIDPDYGAHIPLLTFEKPLAEQALEPKMDTLGSFRHRACLCDVLSSS